MCQCLRAGWLGKMFWYKNGFVKETLETVRNSEILASAADSQLSGPVASGRMRMDGPWRSP